MTPEPKPAASEELPGFPTETEIYILPDGQVVVADLPAELAPLLAALVTAPRPADSPDHDPNQ
jgi:hypothetical protein